jgi:O-antigen ligase
MGLSKIAVIPYDKKSIVLLTTAFLFLISSFWSPLSSLTLFRSSEFILLILFGYYCRQSYNSWQEFLHAVARMGILLVVLAMVTDTIIYGSPLYTEYDAYNNRTRLLLGYTHPLNAADLIAIIIIAMLNVKIKLTEKLFYLTGLFYIFYILDARAPLVGLSVACIYIILQLTRRVAGVYRYLAWFTYTFLFSLATALYSGKIPSINSLESNSDLSSLNGRIGVWAYAKYIGDQSPIFGHGFFSSRYFLLEIFPWAGHAHSSFYETYLGNGIIGLALLIAFIFTYIYYSIRNKAGGIFMTSVLVYSVIHSVSNPVIYYITFPMAILVAAQIGSWEE